MRKLVSTVVLVAGAVSAAPLAAQATRDQARLVFNVSAGYIGGRSLWRVTGQPLFDDAAGNDVRIDTLTLTRSIRPTLTLGVKGIYFRGDNLGIYGEGYLVGLGYADGCARTFSTSSTRNAEVCSSIDATESSTSAVHIGGGLLYRIASRNTISPYVRAGLGAVIGNRSALAVTGRFTSVSSDNQLVDVDVYTDESRVQVTPAALLGIGMTAVLAPGYQLRWEIRDNIVGSRGVSGPTVQDGNPPPSSLRYRHLLGFEVGFDVVLERRRGRRY